MGGGGGRGWFKALQNQLGRLAPCATSMEDEAIRSRTRIHQNVPYHRKEEKLRRGPGRGDSLPRPAAP